MHVLIRVAMEPTKNYLKP